MLQPGKEFLPCWNCSWLITVVWQYLNTWQVITSLLDCSWEDRIFPSVLPVRQTIDALSS